jgi:hypothetical protein
MPDPTPPPYLPAVAALAASAPPGVVTDVFILHDDTCPLLTGIGPCACSPVVTAGFALWWRPNRRSAWERLGTYPTMRHAHDAMSTTKKKHSDFHVLPADGKQP